MPTRYSRIQITEDPELATALRLAEAHLEPGLPRSQQVRALAIAGARQISGEHPGDRERQRLLEELAETFDHPDAAGIDWDLLREGKSRAWPAR